MTHFIGMAGAVVGCVAGQLAGGWAYRRVRGGLPASAMRGVSAAIAAGLVTTFVGSAVFIPFGVQTWLLGDGAPWGVAVFLAGCFGIVQGALVRGTPVLPPAPPSEHGSS